MDSQRIARQATNWKPIDGRRRPGRPPTDWQQTVTADIRRGINWEQIPALAVDKGAWRELTALRAISTGGTKV